MAIDAETRIRVTEDPDQENPLITYVEYFEHKFKIDGDFVRTPCIKNLGKEHKCPICEHSQKLYKAKTIDPEGDGKRMLGKKYYRDAYLLLRGIVIKDGLAYKDGEEPRTGKQATFKLSYQLSNSYKAEMSKLDDDDEFWDIEEGIDFSIIKKLDGSGFEKYDTSSGFARKPSNATDSITGEITDEPLSALIPAIPSYDEADEILERHFKSEHSGGNGSSSSRTKGEDNDTEEYEDELMSKLSRNNKDRKAAKPVDEQVAALVDDVDDSIAASLSDDDDDDDDNDDILRQLKR
jgi:hypothetical protein